MIRVCSQCQTKNRVPAGHLADTGRCGACKQPLPPVSEPLVADVALFDEVTAGATVPVLVDFWAAWCGPCRMVAPEVARVAKTMAGKAVVLKVNTEAQPALSARYNIRSIPTMMVFRDGKRVREQAGAVGGDVMLGWLREG